MRKRKGQIRKSYNGLVSTLADAQSECENAISFESSFMLSDSGYGSIASDDLSTSVFKKQKKELDDLQDLLKDCYLSLQSAERPSIYVSDSWNGLEQSLSARMETLRREISTEHWKLETLRGEISTEQRKLRESAHETSLSSLMEGERVTDWLSSLVSVSNLCSVVVQLLYLLYIG